MKIYALRLTQGQDLKDEIIKFSKEKKIEGGFIISSVGCLTRATIRMYGGKEIKDYEKGFEIVSLVGTIGQDDVHLHISLSDVEGSVIGGHLKESCYVGTTAEIIIGESENYIFKREFDEQTGYKELKIVEKEVPK